MFRRKSSGLDRGLRARAKMTSISGACIMPLGAFWSSSEGVDGNSGNSGNSRRSAMFGFLP